MPGRSTVTVVMPTRDRMGFLAESLASLAAQTYPMDLMEVVVVDDRSVDGTSEFLTSLDTPFMLVAIRRELNEGRAAARNTALEAATGDIVIFIDDDMRCDERLLEAHVAFHETHPAAAVIGSAVQAPELGRSTVFSYLDQMGVHKLSPNSPSPARFFVTNNASAPREAIIAVGLFDESFREYGFEDCELAFRLEDDAGLTFWYCADAVAYHLHSQTLDDVLRKRREAAIPLFKAVEKHPERADELSVPALLPPSPDDAPSMRARKFLARLATNRVFHGAVRAIARTIWLGPLSRHVMVYLIAREYRRGFADVLRARAGDAL